MDETYDLVIIGGLRRASASLFVPGTTDGESTVRAWTPRLRLPAGPGTRMAASWS
jgi:hypothetical protein